MVPGYTRPASMSNTCDMSTVETENMVSFELAECNLANIRRLFERLRLAARAGNRSVEQIAALLDVDTGTAEALLAGRVDLTLSDLQELALAVGAHVGYDVQPDVDRDFVKARQLESTKAFAEAWPRTEFGGDVVAKVARRAAASVSRG